MHRKLAALRRAEAGQTMVEYAAIVAGIAVLLIAAGLYLSTRVGVSLRDSGQATSAPFTPPVTCDANYSGACVPAHPPDVDCSDLRELGIETVQVVGEDPHDLDSDGDRVACN